MILFDRTNQEEKTAGGTYQYRDRDLGIYAALVISLVALGLSRAFVFFFVILRSSRALHGRMFRATLRAPLRFFDTNSVGKSLIIFVHIPRTATVSGLKGVPKLVVCLWLAAGGSITQFFIMIHRNSSILEPLIRLKI